MKKSDLDKIILDESRRKRILDLIHEFEKIKKRDYKNELNLKQKLYNFFFITEYDLE